MRGSSLASPCWLKQIAIMEKVSETTRVAATIRKRPGTYAIFLISGAGASGTGVKYGRPQKDINIFQVRAWGYLSSIFLGTGVRYRQKKEGHPLG
jgi:hypothetical protein